MKYVLWSSIRHMDSRRASGVGYNVSMWHIVENEKSLITACGIRWQETAVRFKFLSVPPLVPRTCQRCLKVKWTGESE